MRIGVFICHCGSNIAGTVDCAKVAENARMFPDVVLAQDIMCRHIDLIRTDTEQEESLPPEGEKTGADTPA